MNIKTNLVVITRNGQWYKIGDCSICFVTDEEYKKLTDGKDPRSIAAVAEMSLRNITHKDIGALL
jgi:hypothetical protein